LLQLDLAKSYCIRHQSLIRVSMLLTALLASPAHAALLDVFSAELALARGMTDKGVVLYRAQALQTKDPIILERALTIALENNDIDGGLAITKHWVEVDPNYIPALFYMAHLSLKAHDYRLATKTLDKILGYDPNAALDRIVAGISPDDPSDRASLLSALQSLKEYNNPSLSVLKAGLLVQAGQPEEALREVNIALRKKPDVTAFITLKANILMSENKTADVQKLLTQEIKRQPRNKSLQLFEVRFLLNNNQPLLAMSRLKKMTQRWHGDGEILLLAGLVSIDNKRMLDAERYLVQLLPIDQYVDQAYFYLGITAERQNHINVAISYFRKVQGDDLYRKAQRKLAMIMTANNQLDNELEYLTQERIEHPEQSSFLYLLQAQLLKDNQRSATARKLLNEAIASLPNQPDLIYARILLLKSDENTLLDRESEHLLTLSPDNPVYLNAFAFALAQQNRRLTDARALAERANKLAPNHPAILDTLGYIALLQKDYAFAIETLRSAYHAEPSANIGMHLIAALASSKKYDAERTQLMNELKERAPSEPQTTTQLENGDHTSTKHPAQLKKPITANATRR
jgi:tetratricopeptide (TPR) repeat protein